MAHSAHCTLRVRGALRALCEICVARRVPRNGMAQLPAWTNGCVKGAPEKLSGVYVPPPKGSPAAAATVAAPKPSAKAPTTAPAEDPFSMGGDSGDAQ
eukprot:gene3478-5641_t